MTYRQIIAFFLIALLYIASCSKQENIDTDPLLNINGEEIASSLMIPGEMRIRVSNEFAERMSVSTDSTGEVILANVKSINNAISSMGITKIERTFSNAGKFEDRTRKAGLHLWYDVQFSTSTPLTKAGNDLSGIEGVYEIEYKPKVVRIRSELVSEESALDFDSQVKTAVMPFNDPMLVDQWHYYNDGSKSGCEAGADINLFPAWEHYTAGLEDVIVGVVDGGIDYEHEDLAANMWHNPTQSGELVYGYNFLTNGFRITPDDHGTHVAGTIAAVNNNGKGVCGIAGGDAIKGTKGIKLMSCQIFDSSSKSGDGTKAIKWSADHGAVISQNSWTYSEITYTPASLKAAVDYFINYAGIDENGNQSGPMKGGIVIFAAGNDNKDVGYPAEYEKVLAVTSICGDYKRAYYSNYGHWTDIIAPGGDVKKGIQVLSTITGNKYGKMQGTSMACPHVSGVAALIVSHKGGANFTNTALWDRLVKNTKDINQHNPGYYLGVGLVDAYAAIAGGSIVAPEAVRDLLVSSNANSIKFKLTVPTDLDDGKAAGVAIYYSKTSFNTPNLLQVKSFETGNLNAGAVMENEIRNLEFSTKYYVAAQAYDIAGNKSSISSILEVTTQKNTAPVITSLDGLEANVKAHETKYLNFQIIDADNHATIVKFEAGSNAATFLETSPGKVQIAIVGKDALAGTYKAKLIVTDSYGLASSIEINYTILKNHPPVALKKAEDITLGGVGQKITFKIADYFRDEDGEILTFNVEYSDKKVCNVSSDDENLYIVAMGKGVTSVLITVTDTMGESCSAELKVLVRDATQEIDIYPNPVVDIMKIRTGNRVDAVISIFNSIGIKVYEKIGMIDPFAPAEIDMKSMSGGTYTVIVKMEGKEIKRNIVKL